MSDTWGITDEYFEKVYGKKKMNAELYDAACASSEFIKKHHPQAAEWEDIIGYCAWYISHGFMVAIHGEAGKIEALACGRPVNDPQDGNIPYKFCENGDCIFIDFMAIESRDPLVLPVFGMMLQQRFGQRKSIAYQRVSMHNYDSFLRNVGRISKIGEPHESTIPAQRT